MHTVHHTIGSMRNSSKNDSILNRTKSGSFYRSPSFSEHGCAFSWTSRGFSDQVEGCLDQSLDGRCGTRYVRQTLPHRYEPRSGRRLRTTPAATASSAKDHDRSATTRGGRISGSTTSGRSVHRTTPSAMPSWWAAGSCRDQGSASAFSAAGERLARKTKRRRDPGRDCAGVRCGAALGYRSP